MRRECRERFPHHWFQRKPLVSDPGMHHGTCVTHVPWCMSGSLNRVGGKSDLCIPGSCATHNFTHLARGPLCALYITCIYACIHMYKHILTFKVLLTYFKILWSNYDTFIYSTHLCIPSVPRMCFYQKFWMYIGSYAVLYNAESKNNFIKMNNQSSTKSGFNFTDLIKIYQRHRTFLLQKHS